MANRDIQLIIRAKNLASKNIDEVNEALSALTSAQDNAASSAKKTDGAIGKLSDELERLKSGTKAVEGLGKAKALMVAAEEAVSRLEAELGDTRTKLDNVGVAASAAATRIDELSASNAQLRTRQQQQQADMENARKGTIKTSDAVKELTKAERAYAAARKIPEGKVGREGMLLTTKARLDAATAAVQRNTEAYAAQKAKLAETAQQLKRNAQELAAAKKSQRDVTTEADRLTASLETQTSTLNKAQGEYAQIVSKVEMAAAAIDKLGIKSSETGADAGKLTAHIERLGAVMQGLMRYSSGSGQFVDPKTAAKMRDLRTQADAVKASWEALESEAQRLAVEIRNTSGNITELSNRQLEAARAAKAAKGEYGALTAELHKVSGAGQTLPPMFNNISASTNRAAGSKRGLKRDTDGATGAMGRFSGAAEKAKIALLGVNRESRQAMSVMQRIRGEVLSLATSYLGLFGAIQGVGGVLTAFQQMEAAQNRLGVVFQQNGAKVRVEMDFLMAQASRLGIQFGTLSDQYSKFAVAADAAGFSTADTRAVFMSLAEAGRVNKLSLEDMNGAFLALTQMISKGKISSEELRQQLGERLPGAMNIMADALGVTTGELYKMLEQGQVLADSKTMLKFADELNRRFGPQLQSSLASTSAQIGMFWNNVFQAQLQVANGGFMDGFNRLLAEMNKWFESREGRDFFLGLGSAAEKLADGLAFVVRNIDLFAAGLQILVAVKAASWIIGLIANLTEMRAGLATTTAQTAVTATATVGLWTRVVTLAATMRTQFVGAVVAAGVSLSTFNVKLALARAGSMALSAGLFIVRGAISALNVALTAMGGPIGVLITLASLIATPLIVGWATGVDGATAALDEHQRIMQAVLSQYDKVKSKADAWGDSIENVSLDEVNANLRKMADAYAKARQTAASAASGTTAIDFSWMGALDGDALKYTKLLQNLGAEFEEGRISAKEYREELDRLYRETDNDNVRLYLEGLLKSARAAEEAGKNYSLAADVADKFGSTLELVAEGLGITTERLGDTAEAQGDVNTGFDDGTKSLETYTEAMNKLAEKVPALGKELKKLSDLAKIESDFQAAIGAIDGRFRNAGQLYADAVTRRQQAIDATNEQYTNFEAQYTSGRGTPQGAQLEELVASTTLLAEQIGVSAKDLLTAMSYETGGTFDPWKAGPTTQWGQHRGLIQWGEPQAEKYGVTAESSIAQQVAAVGKYLLDAGVKPGDGLLQIYAAINAGSASNIHASDANNGGAPGTVLDKVSDQMGGHKARADGLLAAFAGITKATEEAYEVNKRNTEELEQQRLATEKSLVDMGMENDLLIMRTNGLDKEAFILEGITNLRSQNKNMTADQIAYAETLLAEQYELNAALEVEKNKKTDIERIEQRITDLQTQRDALKEQRDVYAESGDTSKVSELDTQIAGVNSELTSAIEKAVTLYEVMGGSGADAAIAKMEALKLKVGTVDANLKKTRFSAEDVNDTIFNSLEGGILNMFDAFANAVANGQNAVKALGQAFRQFAADFLMQIAKMIIQQAIFNMLQKMSGGIGGLLTKLFHTGGVAGTSSGSGVRNVSPAWFNNAARYHTGGIAGLKPNEMPAILELGEEVLTKDNPRHIRNAGGAQQQGASGKRPRIINMFDSASFLAEALSNVVGEETILNYVRANPSAWKQAMGG